MLPDETQGLLPAQYFSELDQLLEGLDARPKALVSPRGLANRGELGDFSSIMTFKALIAGIEDLLGPQGSGVVLIRAGRLRGRALVEDWGVGHLDLPVEKLGHLLDAALGHDGTRLCSVHDVSRYAGAAAENGTGPEPGTGAIVVNVTETICSCAEPSGSTRRCTFTLGAVWGALEALTGVTYEAEQTRSVLSGGDYDQFTFTPR